MDKYAPVIAGLDNLLAHFSKKENEASETDFATLRYIENQVAYLRKLMTM